MIRVAVSDDDGRPVEIERVTASGIGVLEPADVDSRAGTGAYVLDAPLDAQKIEFVVVARNEQPIARTLEVQPRQPSTLELPRRVDGVVGAQQIRVRVRGHDLPPPEALAVSLGEGEVLSIDRDEQGLVVHVRPGESQFPRYVPLLVRDTRTDDTPAWTGLRLRARPNIALQSEPGASMMLVVGSREYGPFQADDEGVLRATVDQYPGETAATAHITDEIGNSATTELPLSSNAGASLAGLSSGEQVPGRALPVVFLRAMHGDGHSWNGADPACRAAAVGELAVSRIDRGVWIATVPPERLPSPQELRVYCSIGQGTETAVRLSVTDRFATRLRLEVYPEELSTDFPVAELQAILEDSQGARLPAHGIKVRSRLGEIELEPVTGAVLRGTYRGGASVVESGEDTLIARYDRPIGTGPVAALEVRHGSVPAGGELEVYARALNAFGQPLAGVELALSAGEEALVAKTGRDGWARAKVPMAVGTGPVRVEARSPYKVARTVALRQTPATGGPGAPEFEVRRTVRISTGRVSSVQVRIDPPALYMTANAVAFVAVDMFDRYGNPVSDIPLELSASAGSLGAPVLDADSGTWKAEYTPPPGERQQKVTIEARPSEGGASGAASLVLAHRPVERSLMVTAGGLTNFGPKLSPTFGFDLEFRTRFTGAIMWRAGISNQFLSNQVTGPGVPPITVDFRNVIIPLNLGASRRFETQKSTSTWFGGALTLAASREVISHPSGSFAPVPILPPGFTGFGGVGWRLGQAEFVIEGRYTFLVKPPNGDVGGTIAQVGGVSLLAGLRVVL